MNKWIHKNRISSFFGTKSHSEVLVSDWILGRKTNAEAFTYLSLYNGTDKLGELKLDGEREREGGGRDCPFYEKG